MPVARKVRPLIHPRRTDYIRGLAEAVAAEHSTPHGTDLDAILEDHSIDLAFDDYPEPFDGLLIKDGLGFRVVCNLATGNAPRSARGRFTIAHELGHYFLDEHRSLLAEQLMPSLGERAVQDNLMEREADLFASHLLLPGHVVRKACKATRGLEDVRQMASKFQVSVKCSAIRFVGEDLVPCCLTFRDWERKLRWKWFSRKAWLAGIRSLAPALVAKGATDQVLAKGPSTDGEIVDSACLASYVFQMGNGLNYNEIFREEAMALGEYGVLTLLTAQKQELPILADAFDQAWS